MNEQLALSDVRWRKPEQRLVAKAGQAVTLRHGLEHEVTDCEQHRTGRTSAPSKPRRQADAGQPYEEIVRLKPGSKRRGPDAFSKRDANLAKGWGQIAAPLQSPARYRGTAQGNLEKSYFARHSCESRNPVSLLFNNLKALDPGFRCGGGSFSRFPQGALA